MSSQKFGITLNDHKTKTITKNKENIYLNVPKQQKMTKSVSMEHHSYQTNMIKSIHIANSISCSSNVETDNFDIIQEFHRKIDQIRTKKSTI